MAEALAQKLYPQHKFYSAGIETHGMNPYAIKVTEELGIDMSGHTSKLVDMLKDINFDVVLTVCDNANESCPIFIGKTLRLHHSFQDPPKLCANLTDETAKLNIYRQVRDEIKSCLVNDLPNLIKGLK
jgi:arsenate reductase